MKPPAHSSILVIALAMIVVLGTAVAQNVTVSPRPAGILNAISGASPLETAVLRSLSTGPTVAGPAIIDADVSVTTAMQREFWDSPTNLDPELCWTLTVVNVGDFAVDVSGRDVTKTVHPGESVSITTDPTATNNFNYVPSMSTGFVRLIWVVRQHV